MGKAHAEFITNIMLRDLLLHRLLIKGGESDNKFVYYS